MSVEKLGRGPPDGGYLAWSQVVASFFMTMCSLGLANSFGVFQSYYQEHLLSHSSPATISWIGTTQGFLINLVGLASGRLYDFGHVRPLIYAGLLLNVLGLVAASFARAYWSSFLTLGVCVGLGSGLFYVPGLAIVASYFSTRQPLATGISATGGSVGGIVYPLLFRVLTDSVGFPWACRVFACANGALLLVSCWLIRPRNNNSEEQSDVGEEEEDEEEDKKKHKKKAKMSMVDSAALRDVAFWLFSISLFFIFLGVDVPFFYLPSFAQINLGLSSASGSYLLAGLNGSAIFGRVLLGLAAVHLNALHVWQASIAASSILLLGWTFVHDLPGVVVFVIIYGFFTGGVTSLLSSALLAISPDLTVVGTRLGMSIAIAGFGFLVGPPIAGVIEEESSGHSGLSLFAAFTYLMALAVLAMMYWLQRRLKRVYRPGKSDVAHQSPAESSQESVAMYGEKK